MSEAYAYPTPSILRESSRGIDRVPICDEMFANREIELTGVVDQAMTYSLCQQLRQLWRDDPDGEITVYVNSPGGSVWDGLAIYDIMQAISCPIRTVCVGMAASMAALIFVAGNQRDMLPHARVMIHDPLISGGVGGSALELKTIADGLMRTRQVTAEVIARHSGHSVEEVLVLTSHDTYFEADEAIAWGLADRVIERM